MSKFSKDDLEKLMLVLPDNLRDALHDLFVSLVIAHEFVRGMPFFVRKAIAKMFGHNIIAVLKRSGKDGPVIRVFVTTILIGLFDLGEDWDPPWPLAPND